MANNFFSRFPTIAYDMDGQGSTLRLTDISKNVDVNDLFADGSTYYTYYEINDGERPDTVSYRLYDNPNYYWTFFILNNELRGGLNTAWPLSANQLESMLEREYDDYSAVTFYPIVYDLNIDGTANSGLFQLVLLTETYRKYLRLRNPDNTEEAEILKWDNALLQSVLYNIVYTNDGTRPSSVDSFIASPYFTLTWHNPTDDADIEALRREFIERTIEIYREFDLSAIIDPALLSELETQEAIDAAILEFNASYVFSKKYIPAPLTYSWASYRNAASEYYVTDADENNISVSVIDLLTSGNVTDPKYISYYEKESIINSRKEKIRVIRKDRISDFVNAYFSTLNG